VNCEPKGNQSGVRASETSGGTYHEAAYWRTERVESRQDANPLLAWRETILFVEDDLFVREVTREVLESAGYDVVTTRNAAEALEAYRRCGSQVDLLITDVIMPGKSGAELARELKSLAPALKVLLITGYGDQIMLGQPALASSRCLAKPFSAGLLAREVRQLLDGGAADDRAEKTVSIENRG
jgi:CheY-like chemotaxis protein